MVCEFDACPDHDGPCIPWAGKPVLTWGIAVEHTSGSATMEPPKRVFPALRQQPGNRPRTLEVRDVPDPIRAADLTHAKPVPGMHLGSCRSADCTGCYPDVRNWAPKRPLRLDGLSADAARTKRNRDLLASGRHPATDSGLDIGPSLQCASCDHLHRVHRGNTKACKCDLHRLGMSHSASSDVRVSWPACVWYERGEMD